MEPHEAGGWRLAVEWIAIGIGVYAVVALDLMPVAVGFAALMVALLAVLLSSSRASAWRRAVKWTAIGIGVYVVVVIGVVILSYALMVDEPEYDPPPNGAVNWMTQGVDVFRFDGQGSIQAVTHVRGLLNRASGFRGFDGLCDSSRFVAYAGLDRPMPPSQTPIEASWLEGRIEVARTSEPLCEGDFWIITDGGSRVVPASQYQSERLRGPWVGNALAVDVDVFSFDWDDPGALAGEGRMGRQRRGRILRLMISGGDCIDRGLVAFTASGEEFPDPSVETPIVELAGRTELGRTTEPLCQHEVWLIEPGGARVISELEYISRGNSERCRLNGC
ncbi:MAG: hypothetical protein IH941_11600 [Acidobacteria bacterium]|nr:hypothetical protein [Acidobacteriota bacterium]